MTTEHKVTLKELTELDANGLLPCPFCGGKPTETSKAIYSMIECCGTRIIDISFSSCQKKWNTRNALPDLIRVIELAEEALYSVVDDYDENGHGGVLVKALSEIRKLKVE